MTFEEHQNNVSVTDPSILYNYHTLPQEYKLAYLEMMGVQS